MVLESVLAGILNRTLSAYVSTIWGLRQQSVTPADRGALPPCYPLIAALLLPHLDPPLPKSKPRWRASLF